MSDNNSDQPEKKPDIFAEKRKKAIEYMGKRWVMHPEYVLDPKHSIATSHVGNFNRETKRWLTSIDLGNTNLGKKE